MVKINGLYCKMASIKLKICPIEHIFHPTFLNFNPLRLNGRLLVSEITLAFLQSEGRSVAKNSDKSLFQQT